MRLSFRVIRSKPGRMDAIMTLDSFDAADVVREVDESFDGKEAVQVASAQSS